MLSFASRVQPTPSPKRRRTEVGPSSEVSKKRSLSTCYNDARSSPSSSASILWKKPKVVSDEPTFKELPTRTRTCYMRIKDADTDEVKCVPAKILTREPWGVLAQVLEDDSVLHLRRGAKYWCVWSGEHFGPFGMNPVLNAVHVS